MTNATSRYTLLLDGPNQERVDRLQESCGLTTRAAVFDLALSVLDWMVQQQIDGHEVGREKNGSFQPLLLPVNIRGTRLSSEARDEKISGKTAIVNKKKNRGDVVGV